MTKAAIAVPDQRLFWDRWHGKHAHASHTEHSKDALRTFASALPQSEDLRLLEIGCGQGREAVALARNGFRVSAFDHSSVAIAAAKTNAIREDVRVDFVEHDAAQPLPYASGTFGGTFAHLSLHYFDHLTTRGIFAEIARVLKPSGVLLFTVRSDRDPLFGQGDCIGAKTFCREGHVRHFFDKPYVEDMLLHWDIQLAEYYDTSDREINPGVFIRVLATRPDKHLPALRGPFERRADS